MTTAPKTHSQSAVSDRGTGDKTSRASVAEPVRFLLEDVLNAQRPELADQVLATDVVDHQKIVLTEEPGPGSASQGLSMFLGAFPDLSCEVHQLFTDGDTVIARFSLQGTNTGAYRYLPAPTGRSASWTAIGIFRVSGGKIVEIWGCADRMGLLTQLGLLPDLG